MNIRSFADEIIEEIIKEYENEKMIENGGFVQRTTTAEFLGGLKHV